MNMPWIDKVPAVLQAWYGGNESGNAIADIIYGRVNASGRLPITLPRRDCYKWVEKRCMNSTILAAVLCNSVKRVIRSAPSRAGT